MDKSRALMRVGINYAWKNYGWDFGPPPHGDSGSRWGPQAEWQTSIDEDLERFRDLGLFAVRWFILGDGVTYGHGDRAPHPDPAHPGAWRFDDPPPLTPEFLADFRLLLERVQAAGLQLLPSVLDFTACFPGMPGKGGYIKQGRHDLIIDPLKRQRFADGVLAPLLEVAGDFRDTILAFELMNEPEWCTRGSGLGQDLLNPKKTVPLVDMLAFLREGISRINQAGFRSSCGFAHQTLSRWDSAGLGISLHQFHYYGDPPQVPGSEYDSNTPLIVGEFATHITNAWPDLGPDQSVYQRLRHLENRGHDTALLWASGLANGGVDPMVDFSADVQEQVRRYISGE